MIYIFYFLAALLVFLSYKSFRGGIDYLDFFKKEHGRPASDFTPFASVIAPCRGLDSGLEANLEALFRQNYPRYEILFVVDAETDEAVPVIESLLTRLKAERQDRSGDADQDRNQKNSSFPVYPGDEKLVSARLVVAGVAENESQKVHNLRAAVLQVSARSDVLVFVDSDVRPAEMWLQNLIAPLAGGKIGAATGYRWFISKKFSFASEMRAVWNASIASALGADPKNNFCWGGSTAIRREVFEKIDMRERWRGTLSDDFALTRALKAENLPVFFVPQTLTASVENCTFRELLEFTTRQIKITRVYAPHLWKQAFVGAAIFNLTWLWGIWILIFYPARSFAFWFALVALLLTTVFSTGKSWLRLEAVKIVLRDYESELDKQFWPQNTLWIISPALFFYNALAALLSRRIVWRGISYELKSPGETVINKESTTNKRVPTSDFTN